MGGGKKWVMLNSMIWGIHLSNAWPSCQLLDPWIRSQERHIKCSRAIQSLDTNHVERPNTLSPRPKGIHSLFQTLKHYVQAALVWFFLKHLSLFMQLSQAQHALQYEEALRCASVSSIEPILREMGTGATPAIEAEDFKTLGKIRIMILDANRQRLLRYGPELIHLQQIIKCMAAVWRLGAGLRSIAWFQSNACPQTMPYLAEIDYLALYATRPAICQISWCTLCTFFLYQSCSPLLLTLPFLWNKMVDNYGFESKAWKCLCSKLLSISFPLLIQFYTRWPAPSFPHQSHFAWSAMTQNCAV